MNPGALKVMSTTANIRQLLRSFKNAIPETQRQAIEDHLDEYVTVTLARNNAVVHYNSSIQLLLEAQHAYDYSKSQANRLGQRKLQLDPYIPAIVFWLRSTRNNIRLELMQRLNYESRAIRFWGLQKELDFMSPGPLQSALQLKQGQSKLDNAFEECLNSWAGHIRVTWPRNQNDKGLFYRLSSTELVSLKRREISHDSTKGIYTVSIRLEPGAAPFGSGRADVRINQVRLWLLGVRVDEDAVKRRPLMVNVTHMGNETFQDTNRLDYHFSHDMVHIPFVYNTAKVHSTDDFTSSAVFSRQAIESNWSGGDTKPTESTFAAIGPFTEWRFSIREAENKGLQMGGVSAGYVEFCGANRGFSVT
ncbi:uncharacterized protein LDX57_004796 [Aspergillus melleus]|uniref:uncharacterized protein n=1 Tax=Aspergillus melleus TaxID=138277 RepID=UPI001E8E3A42|nr:uncharacterized protein LDX57_004796 [Aspergillus melleus]KAH8427078.1 hypothetical protein LDX57_004796 [Aspergillus melleus]